MTKSLSRCLANVLPQVSGDGLGILLRLSGVKGASALLTRSQGMHDGPIPSLSIRWSPPCPESNSLQKRRFSLGKRDKTHLKNGHKKPEPEREAREEPGEVFAGRRQGGNGEGKGQTKS